MRLFLSILRGETPTETKQLFVTEDQAIIRAVARALVRRLGMEEGEVLGARRPDRFATLPWRPKPLCADDQPTAPPEP